MQNSLDRLFAGMAATLADEVAPALNDPYLRSQATAAAELLRTLAPRLIWDADATLPWAPGLRAVAHEAVDALGADALPACAALPDAPEANAYLAALAELAAHDELPDGMAERVRALVDEDAETNRALLKLARR
jgi:hypothetical protein